MRNRGFKGEIRKEILQYCKSKGIGSDRFRPVPMDKWQNIYDEAVDHFVDKTKNWRQGLHWLSINGNFCPGMEVIAAYDTRDDWEWVRALPRLPVIRGQMAYLFIEEGSKFWIFEGLPDVIAEILEEGLYWNDYYIISRKYQWLISMNHEEIVLFAGTGLDREVIMEIKDGGERGVQKRDKG